MPLPRGDDSLEVENKLVEKAEAETSSLGHLMLRRRYDYFQSGTDVKLARLGSSLLSSNTLLVCIPVIFNKKSFWEVERFRIKAKSAYCTVPPKINK
jgi:hypothetical protein